MTTINEFIDLLLAERSVQFPALRNYNLGNQEDMLCCFVGFLVSKCLLRYAPSYGEYGIFVFSMPGRSILENNARRAAFVEEFMNFYES